MDTLHEALLAFDWKEIPATAERYGHGHINVTYVIPDSEGRNYILQRVNKNVFKKPVELMENVAAVTNYLAARTDDPRRCLRLMPTKDGKNFFTDSEGDYWRVYGFISDSICLDQAECGEDFRQSAIAFGEFQKQLSDFPAHTLHEVIPKFHDTKDRYRAFREAVTADLAGRAAAVREEIDFYMAREDFAGLIVDKLADGSLPLRVTHNDTKLNNVMLDKNTRKALCVIDLDTVMPGSALYDYGDSIRFGASTGAEDEKNLDSIWMDLELYQMYTDGFLSACGDSLTKLEIEMLPVGAKMMTLECGMRFLTDYLNGDTYFHTTYEEQNLDRARTHIKLVSDMEAKWDEMHRIVREAIG